MILWMIYDGEMKHYFGRRKIVLNAQVYSILILVEVFSSSNPIAARDALVRFAIGFNVQSSRLMPTILPMPYANPTIPQALPNR
jgi:hypothetical protein